MSAQAAEQKSNHSMILWAGNLPVSDRAFGYIVQGDSMSAKLIDGDVIVVDPEVEQKHKSFVLAEIADDRVIRQLWEEAGEWWLIPSNPAYANLKKPLSETKIIGVVVAKIPQPTMFVHSDSNASGEDV